MKCQRSHPNGNNTQKRAHPEGLERMKRLGLSEVPLDHARSTKDSPCINILIGPEEWSEWIQTAYDGGHTIIEFDENEIAVRAFRKSITQPELFGKDKAEGAESVARY